MKFTIQEEGTPVAEVTASPNVALHVHQRQAVHIDAREAEIFGLSRHVLPVNRAAGEAARCTVKPARVAGEEPGGDE